MGEGPARWESTCECTAGLRHGRKSNRPIPGAGLSQEWRGKWWKEPSAARVLGETSRGHCSPGVLLDTNAWGLIQVQWLSICRPIALAGFLPSAFSQSLQELLYFYEGWEHETDQPPLEVELICAVPRMSVIQSHGLPGVRLPGENRNQTQGHSYCLLQLSWHCAEHFTCILSFKPYYSPLRQVALSPLYRWKNWGIKMLNILS